MQCTALHWNTNHCNAMPCILPYFSFLHCSALFYFFYFLHTSFNSVNSPSLFFPCPLKQRVLLLFLPISERSAAQFSIQYILYIDNIEQICTWISALHYTILHCTALHWTALQYTVNCQHTVYCFPTSQFTKCKRLTVPLSSHYVLLVSAHSLTPLSPHQAQPSSQ